jgi:hypothetical protein
MTAIVTPTVNRDTIARKNTVQSSAKKVGIPAGPTVRKRAACPVIRRFATTQNINERASYIGGALAMLLSYITYRS